MDLDFWFCLYLLSGVLGLSPDYDAVSPIDNHVHGLPGCYLNFLFGKISWVQVLKLLMLIFLDLLFQSSFCSALFHPSWPHAALFHTRSVSETAWLWVLWSWSMYSFFVFNNMVVQLLLKLLQMIFILPPTHWNFHNPWLKSCNTGICTGQVPVLQNDHCGAISWSKVAVLCQKSLDFLKDMGIFTKKGENAKKKRNDIKIFWNFC